MIEIKKHKLSYFCCAKNKIGDKFYVQAQGHIYIIGSFSGYIYLFLEVFICTARYK